MSRTVRLWRTVVYTTTIEIDTDSDAEAISQALDLADDRGVTWADSEQKSIEARVVEDQFSR